MRFATCAVVLLLCLASAAVATPYRAAAIEHVCVTPVGDVLNTSYAVGVMQANLDILSPRVAHAALDGADLVLLSEMALTSLNFNRSQMALFLTALPAADPTGHQIPCHMAPSPVLALQVLQRLSCLARDNGVYLVANWGDRFPCSADPRQPCPADGHLQFNTELAFSPTGALIAKYFKRHTFNATEFDTPVGYPPVYFEMTPPRTKPTGGVPAAPVRIGLAVCFDSMYPDPVLPLLHDHNVSDFVFSHWWVDQYASMAATPWFTSLSRTLGINVVYAASVWEKIFPWGSGSGIVARGVPVNTTYRKEHLGVVTGNDILLTGDLESTVTAPLADALPRYTPPLVDHAKPLPMCISYVNVEADELNAAAAAGTTIQHDLACLKFSCNLTATPAAVQPTTDASARWVLMAAYGYYHMADGGGVYYYENFCGFFQCNEHIESSDCLAKHWHSIDDDHGGRPFDSVTLTSDVATGSMPFAMTIAGDGNVPASINATTSVTYAGSSWSQGGAPVVGPVRGGPVVMRTASPGADLLGASLLARSYDLDMTVVQSRQ